METLRIFLESSTIHGLSYIATTKRFVRLLWILIVIAGFTGAGVIIYNAFQDWADSPVTTTIETMPITDITFPKVTVCPPKNTYTDLNYDLTMTENMTLDVETRNKLTDFAIEIVKDQFFDSMMEYFSKLKEENRYYNWYNGISKISFPYKNKDTGLNFYLHCYALNGSVSTHHFGEQYYADKVEPHIGDYMVTIYVPRSLKYTATLHIDIEKVTMNVPFSRDNLFDHTSLIDANLRRFTKNVTNLFLGSYDMRLQRKVSKQDIKDNSVLGVMPGFRLKWWYTIDGVEPNVTPHDYTNDAYGDVTKEFIRNVFHSLFCDL